MKNKKVLFAAPLFFAVFLISILFSFHPVCAAEMKKESMVIDGVKYELYGGNLRLAEATLDDSQYWNVSLKEEVTVHNQITYKGVTYKVTSLNWNDNTEDWKQMISRTDLSKEKSYRNILKKITIEKGISVDGAVSRYYALEEVVLEDAKAIGGFSFYNCPKLKSIYLPKDYKGKRFIARGCPSLTITVDKENPYVKTENNDIYSKNGKVLYSVNSVSANYKVKNTVTKIDAYAFYGNDQIQSVTLPKSVKNVGDYAFSNIYNLKAVTLSKTMKKLGYGVFRKSPKIKKLTLPKNITKLSGAFGGTSNCRFKKLYLNAKSLRKSNLSSIPKTCKVYVKNNRVKKQVRNYGFKGKIILKANMK